MAPHGLLIGAVEVCRFHFQSRNILIEYFQKFTYIYIMDVSDFMLAPAASSSAASSSSSVSSSSVFSPDLNHDHLSPVFPAGPQPRGHVRSGFSWRACCLSCLCRVVLNGITLKPLLHSSFRARVKKTFVYANNSMSKFNDFWWFL